MASAIEQEILHEIAMSIGTSLDLQEMLKSATSVVLRRLGCTLASVLLQEPQGTRLQQVFTLPFRATDNKQLAAAVDLAIEILSKDEPLPVPLIGEESTPLFYGWSIRNMGLLILGRSTPLSAPMVKELAPLIDKLAHAVTACRQYEDLTYAQRQLKQERVLLENLIANLRSGVLVEDADGRAQHLNQHFIDLFGIEQSIDELLSRQSLHITLTQDLFADPMNFVTRTVSAISKDKARLGEEFILKDGRVLERDYLPFEITTGQLGHLWHYRDITDRKLTEQRLRESQNQMERLAHHDALTGLPNRILLGHLLEKSISRAQRREQLIGVCFVDLDGFKPINDRYGHNVGDRLLIKIAKRLQSAVRESDEVARLGGDEFVMLLGDLSTMEELHGALNRTLELINNPYVIDGKELNISASIGVTVYPIDYTDTDSLLRHADQAMYRAKQAGRNRYQIFDVKEDQQAGVFQKKTKRLWQALQNEEFVLHYQPKVNIRNGQLAGLEALIRWQHPELGLLLPARFLPQIERNHDLSVAVGEWVITNVLRQLHLWSDEGYDISVSVNIAANHLQTADFIERFTDILSEFPNRLANQLELEILETAAIEQPASMRQVMENCTRLGLRSSLDDFGTGYSSLAYLKHLPVHAIKIDKSFIKDMMDDPDDFAIIDGIIGLATAFQREVIAEGVENIEQGLMLMRLGCDMAQGDFIAAPMQAIRVIAWIGEYQPPRAWIDQHDLQWTREDFPLLAMSVEHKRWVNSFIESLTSGLPLSTDEVKDEHLCCFGHWYELHAKELEERHPDFPILQRQHTQVHLLAHEIVELYNSGKLGTARARLNELLKARDQVIHTLVMMRNAQNN
jgi:diguanylate cyclase (GGDEF)-like protein/PAS domain S-box-containing protein